MWIHAINLIANLFSPEAFGSRLRIILINRLGNSISLSSRFAGGGYVYGRGLTIGVRSFVGRDAYFDLTARITLAEDVVVGHGATFITADHAIGPPLRRAGPVKAAPIRVERGAWLGANVTVMPGVTVGSGAVIAAGSLVRHNVACNTVVAGVPARVIRVLGDLPLAPRQG